MLSVLFLSSASLVSVVDGHEVMTILGKQQEYQLTQQPDVRVISRDDLVRYGDQSLAEALSRQPGILLSGPPGKGKDLRLKGLDKGYSQILINGKPVPGNGEKREFDLSSIPLAWVERVEVLHASDATVSGAGIGGTLNIVLKDHRANSEVQLSARRLDGNDVRPAGSLSHAFQLDQLSGRVGIDYLEGDADKFKLKQSINAKGEQSATEENEDRTDKRTALTTDLQYNFADDSQLKVQGRYSKKNEAKDKTNTAYKLTAIDKTTVELEDKDNVTQWLDSSYSRALGEALISLDASYRDQQEDKDKLKTETDSKGKEKSETELEEKREQLRTVGLKYGAKELQLGVEQQWRNRYRLKYKNDVLSGNKDSYDFDEQQLSLYGRYNLKTDFGKWSMGLRAEKQQREAFLNEQDFSSDSGWDLLPNLKYQLGLGNGFQLRASGSRTVRWPKFDDMVPFVESKSGTLTDPDKVGNPDLQPEQAWGADLALVWRKEQKELEIYANKRWVDDLIVSNTALDEVSGRYVQKPTNLESGQTQGWGSRVAVPLVSEFWVAASVDWQQIDASSSGSEFKQVPQMYGKMTLDWRPETSWQAGLSLGFQDETEKTELTATQKSIETEKAMTTVDAYVSYQFENGARVNLSALGLNDPEKRKSKSTYDLADTVTQQDTEWEQSAREWVVNVSMPF